MKNNKRQFYRHPIKVPIRLTRIEETVPLSSKSEDLSEGGLSFYWPDFIPAGTHLQLAIPVEKQLFEMNARVAYSIKDESMGLFRTGVCFKDSTSAFRAKLAEEIIEIRDYREKMELLRGQKISEEDAAIQWIGRHAEAFAKLFG
ncbi:MAG: PilZ domain protein [Candidatus Omnitrophica bacterium ADurb.Bin277]|nr:MAG: PilZ domain protein [Candidatus Omnitrophica bacterium ADurb.Bin277]